MKFNQVVWIVCGIGLTAIWWTARSDRAERSEKVERAYCVLDSISVSGRLRREGISHPIEIKVSSTEFRYWPFSALEGHLSCRRRRDVVLRVDDTLYALNGIARSAAKVQGYVDALESGIATAPYATFVSAGLQLSPAYNSPTDPCLKGSKVKR